MTFTEITSYLEDDPFFFVFCFFFFVFCFFCFLFFFLFEMDQIVLGNLPNDKRNAKNFASGLIVPGDLSND